MSNNPQIVQRQHRTQLQEVQFGSELLAYNDLATSSENQGNSASAKR